MSIDPRTIKELLRLQILNKANLLSANTSNIGLEQDSDFSSVLDGLIAGQQQVQDVKPKGISSVTSIRPALVNPAYSSVMSAWNSASADKTTNFDSLIDQASRKYGIEPSMVKAVIHAESSFNPRAVSNAGAKGLMQLMDGTSQEMGVKDPFNPAQNIEGGTRYLSNLLKKYKGNIGMALAAYNAGSGRVDRLDVKNDGDLMAKLHMLPGETQQYVRKVLQLKQDYEV